MPTIEGNLNAQGLRVALVASRFNEFIVSKLIEGATDCLVRHGAAAADIDVVWVPGAFEIPFACKKLAANSSAEYDAVIALGAVIRGDTSHYDLICNEVAKGVAAVGLEAGVPVIFGVITADTIAQAIERAGTKAGNKGFDAAMSAIEMANLARQLSE